MISSSSGNFVWVDLGGRLGFQDVITEKRVFQELLDGGVYIVSGTPPSFVLNSFRLLMTTGTDRLMQAPGTAYHNSTAGWYRITFSVSRDNLLVSHLILVDWAAE